MEEWKWKKWENKLLSSSSGIVVCYGFTENGECSKFSDGVRVEGLGTRLDSVVLLDGYYIRLSPAGPSRMRHTVQ